MLQVDFYIGKETAAQFALRTACRIAEKAYQTGLRIHIQTDSADDSEQLDTLLWTFRDRSFIPHQLYPSSAVTCPVTIGNGKSPEEADMLINVSQQIPENIKHFQRIAEIIDSHPASIHAGRKRYRFYREQGYAPQHHEVSLRKY